MARRFVVIWFRFLEADRVVRRRAELKEVPFAMALPQHGRMVVKSVNEVAYKHGVRAGMVVADCRAILPSLQVLDHDDDLVATTLHAIGEWCIMYTPVVAADPPDGLVLDISGCAHLWGGEVPYLKEILSRLRAFGYHASAGMADTVGAAWAMAHFVPGDVIVATGQLMEALMPLPPNALRLPGDVLSKLHKLGLHEIRSFITMPRRALVRRFGEVLLMRLDQALGQAVEPIQPIKPVVPHQVRKPCLDPVRTAASIEHVLTTMLEELCRRLASEDAGLRNCVLTCYRVDRDVQQVKIGTSRPSRDVKHLYKLFEQEICNIEPDLGIELFLLEATIVEALSPEQEALWNTKANSEKELSELIDRVAGKVGGDTIKRYLPDEHYWPERSVRTAGSLNEKPITKWRKDIPRPVCLLPVPEVIDVTVPIPDYPPMLFRYKGELHQVVKADGPERIEQEWWIADGLQRDYYCVEDEQGSRFWLFRSGHYGSTEPKWFMHGFFA